MPNLVNSILEKIDEIRVSRDSLKQIISDNLNVDASAFKLIECMNYIENNVLKPSFAIRPKYEEYVDLICPLNVRLTNTSWVSLDFAMNDISLDKELVYLFGIHENSLKCYLTNGKLCLNTGTEITFNKEINLDTNRHTLAFGFTGEVREQDGYARFQVEFDDVVVANEFVQVPAFNLPFSLYDIPHRYDGTYEDYIAAGGITYLINQIEYTRNKSLFDVFALNFYDIINGERKAVKAYSPGLDSEQKTAFLENISGEYQYPESGRYLYIKILGDTTTVITNSSYEKPLPPGEYYLKPSEGAILPTDIVLTSTTQITMYIKGIDAFDQISDGTAEEILRKKVMFGAQPNLFISPIDGNDVNRNMPWWGEQHKLSLEQVAGVLSNGTIGMCVFGQQDNRLDRNQFLYSSSNADSVDQIHTLTMTGEHVIKFGHDVFDVNNINLETDAFMKRVLSVDSRPDTEKRFGPDNNIHVAFNNSRRTPICFFGTYNNVETTPNDVISLGYNNALNQIGYTTGIRYGVKRIDISVRNADGTVSMTHRLISATDSEGVNYFKDTVSGSSYYVFNGTLDKVE